MIVEMRTYWIVSGMRERFLEIFRSRSVPAHAALGMPIVGPFPSLDQPDVFFFMRCFPDAASRDALKAAFYEGKLWKEELERVLMPMIDRYDVVLVEDSERLLEGLAKENRT